MNRISMNPCGSYRSRTFFLKDYSVIFKDSFPSASKVTFVHVGRPTKYKIFKTPSSVRLLTLLGASHTNHTTSVLSTSINEDLKCFS